MASPEWKGAGAAYQDQQFAQKVKERLSSTSVAHIRYALNTQCSCCTVPPAPHAHRHLH